MPKDNALHTAAKAGNVAEVQSQVGKFDINAKGKDDGTALYLAAREGKTEIVKLLLNLKPAPDVNLADVSKLTMESVHLTCNFMSYIITSNPACIPLGMNCYHS